MVDYLFSWAITMFKVVTIGATGYFIFIVIMLIAGLLLGTIFLPFYGVYEKWFKSPPKNKQLSVEEQRKLDKYNPYKTG